MDIFAAAAELAEMTTDQFEDLNNRLAKLVISIIENIANNNGIKLDVIGDQNRETFRNRESEVRLLPYTWIHPRAEYLDYPAGLYSSIELPTAFAPCSDFEQLTRFMIYRTVWDEALFQMGSDNRHAIELVGARYSLGTALLSLERDRQLLEAIGLPSGLRLQVLRP